MIAWDLVLGYKGKRYDLKAEVVYTSKQVMRIRVEGRKGGLLLENNYPMICFTNSRKGIKWKLREGKLTATSPDDAQLLMNIFSQLEANIKRDFKLIYPEH